MSYDTTKHNLNWISFGDAKSHMERHAKIDEYGYGEMKIMHNTRAQIQPSNFLCGGLVTITLHWTDIFQIRKQHDVGDQYSHSVITLDSGGFRTVTTKDRMNRFLPPNYRITQRDWTWYLQHKEYPFPITAPDEEIWSDRVFYDGMQIRLEEVYSKPNKM